MGLADEMPSTFSGIPGVTICAHRGGLLEGPENTMALYDHTVTFAPELDTRGALSSDTHVSATGSLVIWHDVNVDPTVTSIATLTAVSTITDATWPTITRDAVAGVGPAPLSFFSTLLSTYGGVYPLIIEMNVAGAVTPLITAIGAAGRQRDVVLYSSTRSRVDSAVAAGIPGMVTYALGAAPNAAAMDALVVGGIEFILISRTETDVPGICTLAHSKGLKVWAQPVTNSSQYTTLKAQGIDGVLCDVPTSTLALEAVIPPAPPGFVLHSFDTGADGAPVGTGGAVDAVVGTPAYETDAAVHGSLGLQVGSATVAVSSVRYLVGTTNSGSLYFKATTPGATGSNRLIQWGTGTNSLVAALRLQNTGTIAIATNSGLVAGAIAVTTWAPGDVFRFDWQYSETSVGNAHLVLRIFRNENIEGITPDETLDRVVSSPAADGPTSRLRLSSTVQGWFLRVDTLRLSPQLEWAAPFAPPGPTTMWHWDGAVWTPITPSTWDGSAWTATEPFLEPRPPTRLHSFEEGVNGAPVVVGVGDVADLNATPTYSTDAATHGALGVHAPGRSWIAYPVATPTHSFSVYFRLLNNPGTSSNRVIGYQTTGGTPAIQFRFHSNGTMGIVDGLGNALGVTGATWTIGDTIRVDGQFESAIPVDETNPPLPGEFEFTLTCRVFKNNSEGAAYDEQISRTCRAVATVTRFRVGGTTDLWDLEFDTVRTSPELTWPLPYNPGAPVPGQLGHTWVGTPSTTGFVITARTQACTRVRLGLSTSPEMISPTYLGPVTPSSTGHVRFDVGGLSPGTTRYYQFTDTPAGSAVEEFIGTRGIARTLPGGLGFRVALGACLHRDQKGTPTGSTALNDIHTWNPDFMVHMGDFYYTALELTDPGRYISYYANNIETFPGLYELCRDVPMFYCISDHEAGPDNGDSFNAWNLAHDTAFKQVVPYAGGNNRYHAWTVGRVRFILLDCRSTARSAGALPVTDPAKTMLGSVQKAWLKTELLRSEKLKVVISDTPWIGPATLTEGVDKWFSYDMERQELATFINANAVNVDMWTGDNHGVAYASRTANTWGGFPVLGSAPLGNQGGGRHTTYYTNYVGDFGVQYRQYMRVTFVDNGTTLTRSATAWNAETNTARFTVADSWT